jgi:SAM-dependent methyltransferase
MNKSFERYNEARADYLHLKTFNNGIYQRGGTIIEEPDYLLRLIESNLSIPLSEVDFLEVGGGNFSRTLGLSIYFKSFTGIEIRKRSTRIASNVIEFQRIPNATIINSDINTLDLEETYDVIYMRNSLHLANLETSFPKLIQSLRPNGVLFIEQTEAEPVNWLDKRFVRDHPDFNEEAWNEWKAGLESTLEYVEDEINQDDGLELEKHTIPYYSHSNHMYVIKNIN